MNSECKLKGEKRRKGKNIYPQNTVTGKQRFRFSASKNQNSFPGMNRLLSVNPVFGNLD